MPVSMTATTSLGAAGGDVPGFGGIDVGIDYPQGAVIVEIELLGKVSIVGRLLNLEKLVSLGVQDIWVGAVGGQGVGERLTLGEIDLDGG